VFESVSARKYYLEYYFRLVDFTIAIRAVIPCTAWSRIALFVIICSSILYLHLTKYSFKLPL